MDPVKCPRCNASLPPEALLHRLSGTADQWYAICARCGRRHLVDVIASEATSERSSEGGRP